ncbi:MAG: Rieske 2Fe-2S domain-containing protein [Nostoc sp.]
MNPICTHLGCTFEWDLKKNHFICACHRSQYDSQGRVVHRPAKPSLALITVLVKQKQVRFIDHKPAVDPP